MDRHYGGGRGIFLTGTLLLVLFLGPPMARAADPTLEDDESRQALQVLAEQLVDGMRVGDVEFLVGVLDDHVVFDAQERSREEVAAEIRSRVGRLYAYLFDTSLYRQIEAERRATIGEGKSPLSVPSLDAFRSVMDHFRDAQRATVVAKVLRPSVSPATERPMLGVADLRWPGRPDVEDMGNCGFILRTDGWRLRLPFSLHFWSTAPSPDRP